MATPTLSILEAVGQSQAPKSFKQGEDLGIFETPNPQSRKPPPATKNEISKTLNPPRIPQSKRYLPKVNVIFPKVNIKCFEEIFEFKSF